MSRTFLLQDWTTIRAASNLTSVVQAEECWLDVDGYSDATCWIDVAEVTPPGSGNSLALSLETASTCEDAYFVPMSPPVSYGAAPFNVARTAPLVARSIRSATTSNLMRYLRWKITPNPSGAAWDMTFRIRVVATRSPAFSPLDLAGCLLWLRGDMGVTFSGTSVSQWNDQSGNGNNASQVTAASQPTFSQTAMNNLPAIQGGGVGTPLFMTTPAFTIGSDATILVAAQPSASPQTGFARLVEQRNDTAYYLGVNSAGAYYKFIAADNTSPFGTAEGSAALGGAVTNTANTIIGATYRSSTTTGTLYMNGNFVAADSTHFASPGSTPIALTIMQRYVTPPSQPWLGFIGEIVVYNRALSAPELTRVHRYLGARYGIAVP